MTLNQYLISPLELQERLKKNEKIQLIDVRTPEKHAAFNIGGKLIPFDELTIRLHEIPFNQPIVTYCTSGGRSMMALKLLLNAGYQSVKSLDGGMQAWKNIISHE